MMKRTTRRSSASTRTATGSRSTGSRFSPGNGKAETVLSEAAQTHHPRYRASASRYPWLTRRLRGSREPEAAALSAADEDTRKLATNELEIADYY